MNKKWIKIFISALLLVTMFTALVGCSTRGDSNDTIEPEEEEVDSFYTAGYVAGTTSVENIYTDLMGCLANTIDIIGDDVSDTKTASTVASISVDINGKVYVVEFKLNINLENQEMVQYTVEVYDASELVLAIYTYRNVTTITTYVMLGDSKFYWDQGYDTLDITFPIQFETDKLDGYATLMSSIVMIDTKSVKYEYKAVGTKMERHYYFSLDMSATMTKLVSLSNLLEADQKAIMEILLENLIGVGFDDIAAGNMPQTQLSIEFTTTNGYNNSCGAGTISDMTVGMEIAATGEEETIFSGDAVSATIDITSLEISSDGITNYKKQSTLSDYIHIEEAEFNFFANIVYDGSDTQYDITGSLKPNFFESLEDQLYIEVTEKETGDLFTMLSLSSDVVQYGSYIDGEWVVIESEFDFVLFLDGIRDMLDTNKTIAYSSINSLMSVFASLSIKDESQIVYSFMYNYFDEVFNIEMSELMKLMLSASPTIADDFAEYGIVIEELLQLGFDISVDNTTTYVTATKIENNQE